MKWFRMYHTILDSLKVRKLERDAQLDYFLLLCCASEYRERANANTGETGLTVADAVWRTRSATLEGTFQTLMSSGLACLDDDGKIVMVGWEEKQFASDDVSARTLKSKNKTKGNVPGNVPGHVRDTDTDTDTEVTGAGSPVILKTYLERLRAKGEHFITNDDPIWKRAEDIGLPLDFVKLEHFWFTDTYLRSKKRYANWRQAFRNAVDGRWGKLWWLNHDGAFELTSDGRTLELRRIAAEKVAA